MPRRSGSGGNGFLSLLATVMENKRPVIISRKPQDTEATTEVPGKSLTPIS